ncbi:solute carrier family 22 member 15-like isoform X2 [Hydra vulgaris]
MCKTVKEMREASKEMSETLEEMSETKPVEGCTKEANDWEAPCREMVVDDILIRIGQFERAQISLLILFFLMYVPTAYQVLITSFVGYLSPWRCVKGNNTDCKMDGIFSIGDDLYDANCHMNRSSWEFILPKEFSFTVEWNLVCEKKTQSFLLNSALFIGWAAGTIVLGILSDRFGRKRILFPCWIVVVLSSFACAFVNNFWIFFALRLLMGLLQGGIFLPIFSLTAELVGPKYRSLACTTISLAYSFAQSTIGLQAWLIPNWRHLLIVCSIPYILLLASYTYIPESVRWLLVHKKMVKAEKILRTMAARNKKKWPLATLKPVVSVSDPGSFINLFVPKENGKSTLILCFSWFVNALVYFGLSLASSNLGGDRYVNFTMTSLIEFPGSLIAIYFSNKIGRRLTVILSMVVSGLSCIGVSLIPQSSVYNWARISLALIGKLFIAASYDGISIWSAELYPTIIRNQSIGLLSTISRIGGAAAPWGSQFLSYYSKSLPFIIMGSLTIISGVSCCLLRETRGLALKEVFGELDDDKKTGVTNNGYSNQLDVAV